MDQYVIIVAGGIGTRMKSDIPKQFLLLKGIPILMHTVRAFQQYSITLVLPKNQHKYWSELCGKHHFETAHDVVSGGDTRFRSVKNGLENIPNQGLVAIHDGVRPLVSSKVIEQSFVLAKKYGNAIATTALKDSIREVTKDSNKAVNRSKYQLVQTPQTFDIALIKKAYQQQESPLFTDDASLLEDDGHSIHLFEGSDSNIKITTPEDMKVAEGLMK